MSHSIWEKLLKAEDNGEELIEKANKEGNDLIEAKRKEASDEVSRLKADYKEKLDLTKKESDQTVKQLQEGLKSGQQAGKDKAAKEVILKKDDIVKILLEAVLKVEIGKNTI